MSRREQLEKMLDAEPDDVFLQYALAMQCASDGDRSTALSRLQQVIDGSPNYVAAYFQRGQLLDQEGETQAAREVLSRGIEVARQVGESHAEMEMTEFLGTL